MKPFKILVDPRKKNYVLVYYVKTKEDMENLSEKYNAIEPTCIEEMVGGFIEIPNEDGLMGVLSFRIGESSLNVEVHECFHAARFCAKFFSKGKSFSRLVIEEMTAEIQTYLLIQLIFKRKGKDLVIDSKSEVIENFKYSGRLYKY